MPAWPGTLPQLFQRPGFKESEADNLLRTPMDKGPPKVRRRGSDAPRPHAGSMLIDGTQYSAFRTFYKTTLAEGSLTIDSGLNDAHGVARVWRITLGNDYWQLSLELEELP
jgi:hypothetical protein